MVFESLVVELINRYLGDFVENLDTSQLKIGIWGGDVVLNNLNLKESALDDLDLPVKIKAGHIGKLVLKIPWKNLYKEAVIAEIDGIYALAVPNVGIKYNAEKEEKAKQDAKQKKLAQIEEAKKLEAQKGQPVEEKQDSFAEKLATQVIKNLQVRVSNIHVRYEDRFTNPKRPFSIGLSLQDLLFQTTDENWKPCVIKDAVTQIYKLIKLDSVSVYWNSCSPLLDGQDREQILVDLEETLKSNVASQGHKPGYHYIVRPISSVAHLRLNTKPEQTGFSIPKIGLTVVFDEIAVGLTKDQYDDILEMLESMERMNLLSLYRKYRPDLPLPGNAKAWWHYAYTSVLEETVRRRRRMWSWSHIIEHRRTMKRYREAYVQKLDSKKLSSDVQKVIEDGEKYLDVFSLTVMRQQAEVEAAKLGAKRKEESDKGWFGGWFGGGGKKEQEKAAGGGADMQKQFQELYTPEEKAKLYSAIGYEENEADLTFPVEFVAVKVVTKLRNVTVFLRDVHQKEPQVLKLQLKDVYSSFGQRPAASAIQLEAKVDKVMVSGMPQNDFVPKMITSQVTDKEQIYSLLTVAVETNPLDGKCDTSVKVKARPLEIIYDALTVNKLADFFKPPESVQLKQFSQAAMAKFDEIKEQSSTGIQYAIEQHKYTDISVDLMSSYVIVPEGGSMRVKGKCLVLDLGQLQVSSQKHDSSVQAKESLDEKMKKAYDKFNIQLQRIQLLFAQPDDNWRLARDEGESPLHILSPISIILDLNKCILQDPRMAKMKVSGLLPNISVTVSDARIKDILLLVQSIPFPESPPAPEEDDELFKGPSDLPTGETEVSLTKVVQVAQEDMKSEEKQPELKKQVSMEYVNFVDMELTFEIKEVVVAIRRKEGEAIKPYMRLVVKSIGTNVQMRTFDMVADAYLGAVFVQHLQYTLDSAVSQQLKKVGASGDTVVNLVNTPVTTDVNYKLLTVHYLQANKKGPEFSTTYNSTEQTIHVTFCALELLLHQGAILSLMDFAQNLTPPSGAAQGAGADSAESSKTALEVPKTATPMSSGSTITGSTVTATPTPTPTPTTVSPSASAAVKPARKRCKRPEELAIVQMKVVAVLNQVSVGICNDHQLLTQLHVKGIEANVAMRIEQMTIKALLKDLTVLDPDPKSCHHRILCIEGSEVLKANVTVYNEGTEGEKYADMSCVDTAVDVEIGCIKVVFVNKFVNSLLGFVDNFQAAKDTVQEAGQAAAAAGMEAVQSLQETATRLGLKVNMKAPVIIVPQSSRSLNALLLDLGHLSVTNVFRLAGSTSPSGVPAVLEDMKVVLTSLQLSRAMLKKAGGTQAECVVLEPLTISVTMQRNLSAAWYHKHPDIQLGGALEPLTVRLSQGDFATAMQVLNENLSEGAKPADAPVQPATPAVPPIPAASTEAQKMEPAVVASSSSPLSAAVSSSQEFYTKIQVDFQVKGLILYFYSGDSVLTEGRVHHDVKNTLGKFELQVIAMATSIMSDSAMTARVTLMDTILDDLRIAKQAGITRMIERSKGGSQQSLSMIALDFTQNSQQDKKVKLGISSLYICVCVDFLMTLADFFTKGMQPSLPVDTTPTPSTPAKAAADKAEPPAAGAGQETEGSMDIELDMEKPEVILIEDQMNLSTNALVVDMMMSFKMRQSSEEQVMSAGISKLQVFSCTFDHRHQHHTQVLMPCDLNLHSHAKNSKNPHMDISISDIVLNISPSTISTMTAISTGLSPQTGETGQVKRDVVPERLWDKKSISDCHFWFLQNANESTVSDSDSSEMVLSTVGSDTEEGRGEEGQEMLVLNLPSLVVKLEGGIGSRTLPLLIVESSFQAQVKNWSSQMSVEGSLDLEVGYYNEKLAVWEPLIEPVFEEGKVRRWQISLEVQKNDDSLPPVEETVGEVDEQIMTLPSKMVINVTSSDPLQVSLTKTCLEVLNNLAKAFNDAYNLVPIDQKKDEIVSPYLFQNQTGYEIVLKLDTSFEPPASSDQGRVRLGVGTSLPVYNKVQATSAKTKGSQIKATQEGEERKIIFQVEQFGATRELTVKRAEKRLFHINQKSHQGDTWSVVCTTDCTIGQKLVSLHSIVRVKSELTFAVEVQYRGDTGVETCGMVHPGQVFSLPLNAVYSISPDLFFKPHGDRYTTSKDPVNWRSTENTELQEVCCPSMQKGHSACYFSVYPEVEEIFFEMGEEMNGKCHILTLQPSVILHNLLPLSVNYMLEGTSEQETLTQGENEPLMHASFSEANLEIMIPSYQGKEWVGRRKLQKSMPELTVWELNAYDGAQKLSLELGLHCKLQKGTLDISLYAPYWLLNKTGRTLYYRGSDQDTPIEHPPEGNQLILFSFKGKSFFGGKKKAQLRIDNLEWSDKFSLDTVGSSGTVQCKSKSKDVQNTEVGVSIQLSSSGLTKIATFTPFYMFLNTALDSILVTESDRDSWVEIEPGQCQPFWPQTGSKEVKVKAKVKDTTQTTGDFVINQAHTTLLRLNNEYGGINADCAVSESSMITTLRTYRAGLAAVVVINSTSNSPLTFYQSGEQQQLITLNPGEAITYTWDNALGKRELVWSCGKKKDVKNDLIQDGMDEFFAAEETKVYWVSFLDGLQRILFFTEDLAIAANTQEAGELEQVEQEINLQLQGLGLSLVNNYNSAEVAFLGITSSGIIWEERRKRRYRALKLKECHLLENAWQKYQNEILAGKTPHSKVILENKMEVDFADMTVIKPKTFTIRRSFENGIWLQYKTSPHRLQLHAKINRLQLDNQLSHAVFPTVLSPLPPPKSVAADSVPKPFTEVSLMMRKHEHSAVSQIKYFKVLIQEMNLKVDQGFLSAILELFAANEPLPREQETIQLKQDVEGTEKSLMEVAGLSVAEEQKNFYDYLHFSPIKVHLSFSLQTGTGSSDGKPVEIQAGVLNVFLQSVGVVLTDVQDVVFKLGYFERSHTFYNQSQLTGEMTRHYAGQAIKQMYVLVLGLDVLGNPFGLLRGLSEGIEDLFYEPYQGAIQGPEEFAEGLALGVRSLFGHAVGGAAGAVSRITGTLGKGLATLTLDDEYQKKRREQMNKRPATAREGIARGGKGLVMGVVDGVTGIVRKPVEGAKQEGVSGFFKGVGKGLVGVVTRPTSGVIDFASSSFEGIRRIAEVSEDIKRLRPPRRFFKDGVVRPYNHQEAEGYAILQETEKGKYAVTDEYQAHAVVSKDGKNVLIVTDRRVLLAKRGEIFGSWDADWAFVWTELRDDTPKKTSKGIEIVLKEEKKKKFFSSSSNKKEVTIADPKLAQWIIGQIQEQMVRMKA